LYDRQTNPRSIGWDKFRSWEQQQLNYINNNPTLHPDAVDKIMQDINRRRQQTIGLFGQPPSSMGIPGMGGGRSPHSGFPGQSGGTPYIRPDTGASQANMIQAMKAQQMRDSAAANRQARGDEQFKRQQWEQLMQMMQMLIGGGGNQITPPSMGGFNSGQYNMRPPAGEIL